MQIEQSRRMNDRDDPHHLRLHVNTINDSVVAVQELAVVASRILFNETSGTRMCRQRVRLGGYWSIAGNVIPGSPQDRLVTATTR
jgi:hypothetical protein